jgi:hypothetical protein
LEADDDESDVASFSAFEGQQADVEVGFVVGVLLVLGCWCCWYCLTT